MIRFPAFLAAALAAACLSGCGSSGGVRGRAAAVPAAPPAPDSAAIGVWHFDENGGTRVEDSGPFRLDGTAGLDTRTDFGRFRSARVFQIAKDSFVYVPYNPVLDVTGPFTVEAWIDIGSVSLFELQVIAARWTPIPNEQSWVFGVTGYNSLQGASAPAVTGWFASLLGVTQAQHLIFGYVPAGAGGERGYVSTSALPLGRWVHVAATVDGEVVRLYVDGRLDAQYVNTSFIRPSAAPLIVGSALDTRHLTSFGGDLRVDPSASVSLFYPFDGLIDEVRLSRGARSHFEGTPLR
jgi:hypothetical protein